MPKIVDHDARRAELAAAVWRVVARSGIHGATVRVVAAEAGVSPGSLRYYFADQLGLLRFAVEMMNQRVIDRLRAHLGSELTGRELGQTLLEELLPLDEDRHIEGVVYLDGLIQARQNSSLGELNSVRWIGQRHACRVAFASAKDQPIPQQMSEQFKAASDEAAVGLLHAFIDGLIFQGVTYPDQIDPQDVSTCLDRFLSILLAEPGA